MRLLIVEQEHREHRECAQAIQAKQPFRSRPHAPILPCRSRAFGGVPGLDKPLAVSRALKVSVSGSACDPYGGVLEA